MNILIVNNYSKDIEELQNLLRDYQISVCTKESFLTTDPESFDIVIFSGGFGVPTVKNHSEEYKHEINFIQNTKTKVIGICLGCQIIATAFGSTLKELEVEERGITIISFQGKELQVYESHRFAIDSVGSEIEVLGTSNHGVEIIKHKTKPILGLQFHPEMFIDRTEGWKVFMSFLH